MKNISTRHLFGSCRDEIDQNSVTQAFQLFEQPPTEIEICKRGSRSLVGSHTFTDVKSIYKYYYSRSFHHRLKYMLTQSRAQQGWNGAIALEKIKVPAAKPILFLEERLFKLPARALTLTEHIDGTALDSLTDKCSLNINQLRTIVQNLADSFHQMKTHQITHGDLKASNIIITSDLIPHFIDFDGTIVHKSQQSFQKSFESDRARFLKNWQTQPELQDLFHGAFDKI